MGEVTWCVKIAGLQFYTSFYVSCIQKKANENGRVIILVTSLHFFFNKKLEKNILIIVNVILYV
jgi:hypothetical protein